MDLKAVSSEDTLLNIQNFPSNPAVPVRIDIHHQASSFLYFDGLVSQTQLLVVITYFNSESFKIEILLVQLGQLPNYAL